MLKINLSRWRVSDCFKRVYLMAIARFLSLMNL
jgi:hypothetical protein